MKIRISHKLCSSEQKARLKLTRQNAAILGVAQTLDIVCMAQVSLLSCDQYVTDLALVKYFHINLQNHVYAYRSGGE